MKLLLRNIILVSLFVFSCQIDGLSQCTSYTIIAGGGTWDEEISWEIINDSGVTVANDVATGGYVACLDDGCYTVNLYDSFGDGWNGASLDIIENGSIIFSQTIADGGFGSFALVLGGVDCGGGSGDCEDYTLVVGGGIFDGEISWTITDAGSVIQAGVAGSYTICLEDGCYSMNMFDSFGDGWDGATYTLSNSLGLEVSSGTLLTGASASVTFGVNVVDCDDGGSGTVTASDCPEAVYVCSDIDFSINPNGYGNLLEVPTSGSYSNPYYDAFNPNPWGTLNTGCLLSDELNSTWMIVNIAIGGELEFVFGGLGTQAGYYDWIMWPYSNNVCQEIFQDNVAPVRCNWNGANNGGTGCAQILPAGGSPLNFEPPINVATADQYLICFSNYSSVTTNVPLEFFGTAEISCVPIFLPVELTEFTGNSIGKSVLLEWTTATESNNEAFVLQRSSDNSNWEDVVEINGGGNSLSEINYEYLDRDATGTLLYYRLKQRDFSGYERFSHVITIERNGGSWIYPNPSASLFRMSNPLEESEVVINDLTGRTVSEYSFDSVSGELILEESPGIYLISLYSKSGSLLITDRIQLY